MGALFLASKMVHRRSACWPFSCSAGVPPALFSTMPCETRGSVLGWTPPD
jgi:hypothetical protein